MLGKGVVGTGGIDSVCGCGGDTSSPSCGCNVVPEMTGKVVPSGVDSDPPSFPFTILIVPFGVDCGEGDIDLVTGGTGILWVNDAVLPT